MTIVVKLHRTHLHLTSVYSDDIEKKKSNCDVAISERASHFSFMGSHQAITVALPRRGSGPWQYIYHDLLYYLMIQIELTGNRHYQCYTYFYVFFRKYIVWAIKAACGLPMPVATCKFVRKQNSVANL